MKFAFKYFEELLASIAISIVVISAFYGVISRYILNNPVAWSNEVATIAFTWTVFLGAAAAWKNNKHIHLDLVYNFFPNKIKIISDWLKNIILIVFIAFALYLSIQFTITAYNKPTAILRIPFSYVDVPVVIFFLSIILRSIQKIIK
ncbi:MAG: TRAP transporter small permease [Pelagibacteraceae bacterium]|jgi:TRAP-type C4-dicarboxylate transport system permease small subunit|nr:TRAP transporter small permease [Pelagibacteraceae bacterium]MBT3902148.1 TRAP transporter small permease [Pelagibacteraceae bacterium]MBT4646218.1 TRAP transporter small permease [Pelagibacteraceae bacterium]MBT4951151.1 TRAP transporter small permease [Pelagibacteraceae bacterium]MBT5214550.1 TRAP transporter small permease [Pelagibacteraceae bacterium]